MHGNAITTYGIHLPVRSMRFLVFVCVYVTDARPTAKQINNANHSAL